MKSIEIFQGTDQVLQSGAFVITRSSPAIRIAIDEEELLIDFDLDEPFTRPDGAVVKPTFGADAVTPANTPASPKVKQIGDVRVEYSLEPTSAPLQPAPDATGRMVQPSYRFGFRVLRAVDPAKATHMPPPFDWIGRPATITIPAMTPHMNLAAMSWEDREAYLKANNPFTKQRKVFRNAHEAG